MALKIIKIGRDPDIDLREVAQLLSSDPALASKTLRIANSPLYLRGRGARTLQQAISVLGLNATVSLALSFSLGTSLRDGRHSRIDLDAYWRRALLSALAAKLLGLRLGVPSAEELFLAGLLQDLGMLALDAALPRQYAMIVEGRDHDDLPALERAALGIDHCEAGAWLMREWGLPSYLVNTAAASHALEQDGMAQEMRRVAGCVAASGRIANIYIDRDTDAATAAAYQAAKACLGIDQQMLGEVLQSMAAALPDVESLFDMSVLPAIQALGLTDQARELLATRNLQLLRSATEMSEREQDYRARADELDELSRRDSLTGLFNRRHFDEALGEALALADSRGEPLSVAYLDLDCFKSINDRYGHPVGDRILMATADHIQSRLRADDLLARYGGEEFVMLMPGVNRAAAISIIERIRIAVESLMHALECGVLLRVTLSAGIASYRDGAFALSTLDDLMQAADRALYQAKHAGRNCVRAAR